MCVTLGFTYQFTYLRMNNRHSVRAEWHDYNSGIYFVTICTDNKEKYFGNIYNNEMHLSECGQIIEKAISEIPTHYDDVQIIDHVVMPNHIHILLSIYDYPEHDSTKAIGCLRPPKHDNEETPDYHFDSRLAVIIRQFKASCTRRCYRKLWQRNFYETIIHNRRRYDIVQNYISQNVINWRKDMMYVR
jgi:REP element-mobilizing transposase RayT